MQLGTCLISIIIVTHNAVEHLEKAIQSVLSQSYKHMELLIVDGASSDGTVDVIKEYEGHIAQWLTEPDLGTYDAMNKAVKLAKGDWFYFLGADDLLADSIYKVVPYLRSPRTIYYGDVYLPHKNQTYAGAFRWHTLVSKNINHQSIFYPLGVFEQYSYNLKYPVLADYELNLRCWGEGKFRFKYIPVLIATHNEGGLSHQRRDEAFLRDKPALVRRYFGWRMPLRRSWFSLRGRAGNLLRLVFGSKQ
jgi:glycosyltransferase involved in cell wall biosynthesis